MREQSFSAMDLEGIDHIALAVPDISRAVAWYADVLGLERQHLNAWKGEPVFLGKGNTGIAFFSRASANGNSHSPFLHLAFRTGRDGFLRAQQDLKARGIGFDFEDHGIAHSIYFRDLDGNKLEITTYQLTQSG